MPETRTICRCGRCNRVLRSREAVQAGMGPTCFRKTYGITLKQALKEASEQEKGGDGDDPRGAS